MSRLASDYSQPVSSLPTGLITKLARPAYYRQAIERLHKKLASQSQDKLYKKQSEEFTFAQVFFDRRRVARILAKSVASGQYRFSPVVLNTIFVDGKHRTVYTFCLADRIVHSAIYAMLAEDFQPLISPQVYSYVKGRTKMQAIACITQFVREHRRACASPKERGLYTLRGDIKAYGSSIPVLPSSRLWTQLSALFVQAYGRPPLAEEQQLLEHLIRPVILHEEGGHYTPLYGIPDGAPVSALLLNMYVAPLDDVLANMEGGVYARYCDDMFFAHPDRDIMTLAESQMRTILADIRLTLNEQKFRRVFFNGAGRADNNIQGSSHMEFLGLKIAFDGTVTLKRDKMRQFLHNMTVRAQATACATRVLPLEVRGKMICRLLNDALDSQSPHAHAYAPMFRTLVNDRHQLKQLDYWLARLVLRAVLHDHSVKGFRKMPYRKIRQAWQLKSLVYARNRYHS